MNFINKLIDDLVYPMTEVSRVIGSVAKGDLTQYMSTEIDGVPIKHSLCLFMKLMTPL